MQIVSNDKQIKKNLRLTTLIFSLFHVVCLFKVHLDWVFIFEKTWYMQWGDSFSPKLLGSNQSYLNVEYSYSSQGLISTMILLWQEQTLC